MPGYEEADRRGLAEVEGASLQSTLRRGWYWGEQGFRERLGKLIPKMKNQNDSRSAPGRDAGIADATQILLRAKQHFGLREGELKAKKSRWFIAKIHHGHEKSTALKQPAKV